MIPFNKPYLTGNETHYIYEAVNSGKLGVFQTLNKVGINYAKEKGIMNVRTDVLNTNFSVNGTHIDLGFKIVKSEITLHYWFL